MNLPLYDAIKSNAEASAQSSNWQDVADILNDATVKTRVTEPRTASWLIQNLIDVVDPNTGATEADLVLGTLQASANPRVKAALNLLSSSGVDISDPQSQQLMAAMAADARWPQSLIDKIDAAAFDRRTHAQMAGYPDVTADTCQAHWEAGQAVEAGTVQYDKSRVMLNCHMQDGDGSLNLRLVSVGKVSGVTIEGDARNTNGKLSTFTGAEKTLADAITAAINAYVGSK